MPIGNLGPLCLAHLLPGLPSAERVAGDGAARCGSRNCELSHHLVGGKEVISEFICLTCSSQSHLSKRAKF